MRIRLVQIDAFETAITALPFDPVFRFQKIMEHQLNASHALGVDPDEAVLRHCLTTDILDPKTYADHIASMSGASPLTSSQQSEFETLLECERASVALFWDVAEACSRLNEAGIIVCLNSNLWPHAADHILNRLGLAKHFHKDGLVLSYKEGLKKDDPDMYLVAPKRFGIPPEQCAFVGDSLRNDCEGPQELNMTPFLLNRKGNFDGKPIPAGITPVRNLLQMTDQILKN